MWSSSDEIKQEERSDDQSRICQAVMQINTVQCNSRQRTNWLIALPSIALGRLIWIAAFHHFLNQALVFVTGCYYDTKKTNTEFIFLNKCKRAHDVDLHSNQRLHHTVLCFRCWSFYIYIQQCCGGYRQENLHGMKVLMETQDFFRRWRLQQANGIHCDQLYSLVKYRTTEF